MSYYNSAACVWRALKNTRVNRVTGVAGRREQLFNLVLNESAWLEGGGGDNAGWQSTLSFLKILERLASRPRKNSETKDGSGGGLLGSI